MKSSLMLIFILLMSPVTTTKARAQSVNEASLSAEEQIYDNEGANEGDEMDAETKEINGLETVLCTSDQSINVRNEDLSEVIYTSTSSEEIKVFQGWGENSKTVEENGKKTTFIKINFIGVDGFPQIGFVEGSLIKAKQSCEYIVKEENPSTEIITKALSIRSLDDENCCTFPTKEGVRASMTEGMRRFGANRSKGNRVHAAVDLYRYLNEPIFSVAPGKVVRNLYYFYQGTYALEVVHSGGYIVRYGEITGKTPKGIKKDKQLGMSEQLGFMAQVSGANVEPMLHFELYKGTLNGPLTQKGLGGPDNRKYDRRDDLLNPTPYLLKWSAK